MKISVLKGRLGNHRFHMMLIHFPSALFPFAFILDLLFLVEGNPDFALAGRYAIMGAIVMSLPAMMYGAIDFLQIDPQSKVWKTAGIHALLGMTCLIVFSILLFYRFKHPHIGLIYVFTAGIANVGLLIANYFGGELVIKHHVGISTPDQDNAETSKK